MDSNNSATTTTTSAAAAANGHCTKRNSATETATSNNQNHSNSHPPPPPPSSSSSVSSSAACATTSAKSSVLKSLCSLVKRSQSTNTTENSTAAERNSKSSPPASSSSSSSPPPPPSISSKCPISKSASTLASVGRILSRSKSYLSSLRAESFATSLIPVLLGALLAAKITGQFSIVILLATVLTVLSVHAAGNLVNTYCDFKRGIDSAERRSDDRTLVDSILTPEEVVNLGVVFYLIGCIGFLITVLVNPARLELLALVYFGGLSSSFLYTGGIGLKYIALGDIIIMITFGPVSVLYSFIAQTGSIRLVTFLYAIPLALNAEAILHSNNTRDIEDDRRAGCVTIAVLIGYSASHFLFAVLLFVPYILLMVAAFHYSIWLLLPLITLPKAFALEKMFREGNLRYLPKLMVRLNSYFGMFYLLACFLSNPHKLPGLFQF